MKKAQNIPEMLKIRAETTPDRHAHFILNNSGKWEKTSWKSFFESVSAIAAGLQTAGIQPGDNVGIMAPTSQLWEFVQMAVLMSGAVVVGIDPDEIQENINHIAKTANLTGIIVEHPGLMEKLNPEQRAGLKVKICMDREDILKENYGCLNLTDIEEVGAPSRIRVEPNALATIIFTSGTTGEPKGIVYRHEQVIVACRSILNGFDDMDEDCNFPCWLPLSNLFQRMINCCAIDLGATTYFVDDPKKVINLLPRINPHFFIGVPRIFEKIYEAIDAQIRKKPLWLQKFICLAIKAGDEYASAIRRNESVSFFVRKKYELMDRLILKQIRSFLGSNMKYFISGSAPMPTWLLEKYHALGILVLEAYGISENIIPNAMNTPQEYRFGSVGKPLPENELQILEDGELLVRGIGLFDGYYGDLSGKALFTPTGYFPTGDYVALDADGYLSVTGRKSEVFKTSTGRKIAPTSIEERLRQSRYVEHAVVFGAGKKFIIALVAISKEVLKQSFGSADEEGLLAFLATDLSRVLAPLPGFQRPAGILMTDYQFSLESKELTSNFKLKRKNIETRFQSQMDELCHHLETGQKTAAHQFVRQEKLLVYSI